jgi:hypothetical protein
MRELRRVIPHQGHEADERSERKIASGSPSSEHSSNQRERQVGQNPQQISIVPVTTDNSPASKDSQ